VHFIAVSIRSNSSCNVSTVTIIDTLHPITGNFECFTFSKRLTFNWICFLTNVDVVYNGLRITIPIRTVFTRDCCSGNAAASQVGMSQKSTGIHYSNCETLAIKAERVRG